MPYPAPPEVEPTYATIEEPESRASGRGSPASLERWQESYLEPGQAWGSPGSACEAEEYSSVLRSSSYALLSLGPKSLQGVAGRQGHFASLPYLGAQVAGLTETNTKIVKTKTITARVTTGNRAPRKT